MSILNSPSKILQKFQDRLERSIHTEQEQMLLQPSVFWARSITWSLIFGTAFGLAWLALAQTEEIVVAQGKLEPVGSVKPVQMPLQGVVKDILVKEGQQVKAGQLLLKLDTEASAERLQQTKAIIKIKERELLLKNQEMQNTQDLIQTQVRVLTKSLALAVEVLSRYERLVKEGATAELQYLEQLNKVEDIRGEIEKTKADGLRQRSLLRQQIQDLRGQIAELDAKLAEASVTMRYQDIKAPVSGIVFDLKPKSSGFSAQGTESVLKIVPYDQLKAKVEIASSDIGFVSVGKPVDVSIDSFPATDFGVLQGTVSRIGSDALPPEPQLNKLDYRYPADIKLNSQQLRLKNGQILPLQVGMSLTANIKLRKVTYLQLLLSDFKNKADSLRRI